MDLPLTYHLQSLHTSGRKGLALLIDPDKADRPHILHLIDRAEACGVDYLLVGGSHVSSQYIQELVPLIKAHTQIPVLLFPGSTHQIVAEADAILFLSLISGRNADLLIGRHVEAAPLLRRSGLEVIPTGYLLIESGRLTTANYITQTMPIPAGKTDIAVSTALAGEMLGMRMIYLDGGSGAEYAVRSDMIAAVAGSIRVPLFVGGGIRSAGEAARIWQAGAAVIVIGSAVENDPDGLLMQEIAAIRHTLDSSSVPDNLKTGGVH
jgi:phosphoglycerol geranylgeranyltransferase